MSDTIYALATGAGASAIAVIRVSGPNAGTVARRLTGKRFKPRLATLCALRNPQDGDLLDHALVLWFPGPNSYTGEDGLELQVHGGHAVIAAVLRAIGSLPQCRLAEPGEFSRRALLNGKTDLAALEGLADLIAARTEAQRRQSIAIASGYLTKRIETWRESLISALAFIEAEIDFPDEGDAPNDARRMADPIVMAVLEDVNVAIADSAGAEIVRDGFVVAIAGPPNVGKSSLLNFLAKREAAIVSSLPGTTRDLIEIRLDLDGLEIVLVDTAGLRETDDIIESEGVRRARQVTARANLVLWLKDRDDDAGVVAVTEQGSARIVHVRTKCDMTPASPTGGLAISTITGEGTVALLALIASAAQAMAVSAASPLVTRERHRLALVDAAERLAVTKGEAPVELRAEELRLAIRALGSIIGSVGVEDVLDRLFSQFCIGK